ncbi:type III ribulose-bisphosphate carboxylase [Candidatus Woesearchaeota archaeon]|nr:type III ribulose-bisphosphate carboxylase [Candidatus Woesearchaeota archaeon]
MLEYIDTKYSPQPDDLVAEYYLEPADGVPFNKACEHIAGESSIGTWTEISTLSPQIARKLKPHVFYIKKRIDGRAGTARIAYNAELFEAGNMPEILSSIAGNIFGMKAVKNLRLNDIQFPKSIMAKFRGPKYGIDGIRHMLHVHGRPLCGTIVKPKVGLDEAGHANVAYEAWAGGLDIVKDDENLSSMSFNNFQKRVRLTLKMRDKAEQETGERKMYMANVTAETDEMRRRAEFVKSLGGEYYMLDIITLGWAAVQTMRNHNEKVKMVMHAHRAMHGALTRNQKHGISMLAIAKCARLIGVDQLHIGTAAVGKMHGSRTEELAIEEEIEHPRFIPDTGTHLLEQEWYGIKPVFAVASGGLHAGMTPKLVSIMGKNIIAQYGGGVHWHPKGTRYGAMGVRQAIDAAASNIPLEEYAKTHKELGDAIAKFGIPR